MRVGFGVLPDSVMHRSMLPILRILPVGGVLLAIMILVLALNPPGGSHPSLTPNVAPARGALMRRASIRNGGNSSFWPRSGAPMN